MDFHYVPDLASTTTKVGQAIFDATSTPNNGFPIVDRVLASFIPVVAGLTSNTYRRNGKDIEKPNYGKDTILVRNNKQGEVDLIKVDTNNRPLAGAKFIVKDANGKVIDSWESTDQPHKITGLNAGTYTVVETTPPAGHQLSDEAIELTVDNEGNVTKRKIDRSQVPVTVEEKPENIKGDDLGKKETTNEKDKESIEKVFGKYPQLKKLYSALVDQGKIKKLSLDTTTFVSKNDRDDGKGAIITLGSKYNEGMRYQQDTLFKNQTDDLARKLAHELMHSVVPTVVMKENSPMESLFTALKDVRKHDEKKGLSMLVSKYL
ncbi:MAG: prealbumin-like fold domain-containing protein [Candidatus Peribacteria bacterium]|nr:prealbumin-like fold domain-containing protein [Candidatus Peribacteria bacterium]